MADLDTLRNLIRARLIANGTPTRPQPYADAAAELGCTPSAISYILLGKTGVSVEMALQLAKWLRQPRANILRMAGHDSIVKLLADRNPAPSPHAQEISNLLDGLPDKQQRAILAYLREMIREE